ncbi:hypothetical protein EJB05_33926, partial [Eragrostis curvula]
MDRYFIQSFLRRGCLSLKDWSMHVAHAVRLISAPRRQSLLCFSSRMDNTEWAFIPLSHEQANRASTTFSAFE